MCYLSHTRRMPRRGMARYMETFRVWMRSHISCAFAHSGYTQVNGSHYHVKPAIAESLSTKLVFAQSYRLLDIFQPPDRFSRARMLPTVGHLRRSLVSTTGKSPFHFCVSAVVTT